MALPVYGSGCIHVKNSSSRTVDEETKPQEGCRPRGGCNQLGNGVLAPRLGKLLQSTSSKFVCICGRAGNQQIFHDIRLDVLNSVVKLLLAAGLALKSKNIYFILSPLVATTPALHLNEESWDHNGKYQRILLLKLVQAYRSWVGLISHQ